MAKNKTKAEKDHLNWVASQGCMICGCPACVHHIREFGEPRNHYKTIPLCYLHHQGESGIHTKGKKEWRKEFGHELGMLEKLMPRKSQWEKRTGKTKAGIKTDT